MKRYFILSILLLFIQGCAYSVHDPKEIHQILGATDVDPEYFIQVGDTVRVSVRTYDLNNEAEVTEVPVRPDGKAFFPLLEDEILLAGYTPKKVKQILTDKYRKLIKNPQITVNLSAFGERHIYVGGEVRDIRERFLFNRDMTATRAIMAVGYDTYRGDLNNVILVRQNGNGNQPDVIRLKLKDALTNKTPGQDIALRPNDIVFVPPKGMVQVGDVIRQINNMIPIPGIVYPVGSAALIDHWNIGEDTTVAVPVTTQ